MTKPSAMAAVAGALGAALLVAFFHGSILGIGVGALLSPLPLAMTALGLGLAYLPVAVIGGAVSIVVLTGSFALAVVYLLVDAVPVAALSRLGAVKAGDVRGDALGARVCYLALGAALFLALALFFMPHAPGIEVGGIEAAVRAWVEKIFAAMPQPEGISAADFTAVREQFVKAAAGFLPAGGAWNWILRSIISVALAQHLLARMSTNLWPTPVYRSFAVPGWYLVVFAVAAVAGLASDGDAGYVIGNVAIALCLPLFLQGLAVVHCGFNRLSHGVAGLVVFYVASLFLPVFAWLVLVSLAVTDHFLHLRTRYLGANF